MRDRLSRLNPGTGDDGRTVLEAVVALSIIAATAAAWVQMTTTAARTEVTGDRLEAASALAASELEVLRATPDIENGTNGSGGQSQFDGLTILTDGAGPVHDVTVTVDGHDYDVERYVLDPGSTSWRRLVVVVQWTDNGASRDVRVDTAIPLVPDPVTVGGTTANLVVNGTFHVDGAPTSGWSSQTVPGWTSDRSDGELEVHPTGWQGVVSTDGSFHAELNHDVANTYSQTLSVVSGTSYTWSVDHRGRFGTDTFEVLIDGVVVATNSTSNAAWVTYSGDHVAASSTLVLGFRAVTGTNEGNLIDNVSFVGLVP